MKLISFLLCLLPLVSGIGGRGLPNSKCSFNFALPLVRLVLLVNSSLLFLIVFLCFSFITVRMAKGDPKKPKGKMSAYAFFVQTCREEHKKKNPEVPVNFAEFSKKCSERWKVFFFGTLQTSLSWVSYFGVTYLQSFSQIAACFLFYFYLESFLLVLRILCVCFYFFKALHRFQAFTYPLLQVVLATASLITRNWIGMCSLHRGI